MTGYHWLLTQPAQLALTELQALRIVFEKLPDIPAVEDNLRRLSLLNSAIYSAKIEGIPVNPQANPKLEVQNLLTAYKYLQHLPKNPLSIDLIKKLHEMTLNNLSGSAGQRRAEPWAVYNQAGVAIHLAPAHFTIPDLMADFMTYVGNLPDPAPVIAAVAQFIFEKIHPFADGNGRVGRLISTYLLTSQGYNFRALVSHEQYIDQHRESYYLALEPSHDITAFVEFFLISLVAQVNVALNNLKNAPTPTPQSVLLPRRQEILNIIQDHPGSSFDFLSRRFPTVNYHTLHQDVRELLKRGFIEKIGLTRGATYKTKAHF